MPMLEAAEYGDIFITVTGCRDVITREHYVRMKNGAILCNAGHFDVEVNKNDLRELAGEPQLVRRNVEAFEFGSKRLYLLAEGRLVNLAAADGHPAEIMDMSFALQVEALHYLNTNYGQLPNEVLPLPQSVDDKVARHKLAALGMGIDKLTPEQEAYLQSWK